MKVAGLKLDKYGGVIGKRWGLGESDEENLERMHSILSSKNWSNELASECLPGVSGDELEGLREVLNSKFPKVCEGWRMIQLQV